MAQKQYIVIAGAIPAVHDRKIVIKGEILNEDFFKDGEIGDLIKGKFIKEHEEEEVKEPKKSK